MSRFDLHLAHIDGLVNAGLQFGLIGIFDDLTPVGQMLLQQHRPHHDGGQQDGESPDYVATVTARALHPIAALCLLECYEYQTSGTIGWHTSEAHAWTDRLRATVLTRLPAEATASVRHGAGHVPAYRLLPAYTETPWGITELDQIPELGDGLIDVPVVRKGLRAEILTGPFHSPNKGLSSRVRHVTILGVGQERTLPAFARIAEPSDDAPGVYLLFEHGRYVARPAAAPPGTWFMASGAHLHTSDSRLRELIGHSLPIPLHDRTEP
ncbi:MULTISPECIES: hypothetical protein [unclassified Crossiella]|uniref:hypothetical protein n=1 Tax=unclassified Crossiella TaxID=2620835 RepID=UPI001FFFFA89|nr:MULTISPECIES: hypothetical protein [unclassified Crossiella]MCK2240061.1 hypothetical protein [Crossiella sp. S99.2]MCK2252769.1 hypothetical protein [Crossiella sp. S99.1]